MSNKKILFIHHLSVIGGATKSLLSLTLSAQKKGYDVSVLFFGVKGNAFNWFVANNIDCHNFSDGKVFQHANGAYIPIIQKRPYRFLSIFLSAFFSIKKTRKIISKFSPDLVYLNTSLLFPSAIAAKQLNLKVIWHLREQIHDGIFGLRKRIMKSFFKKFSDHIVAISHTNANKLNLKKCNVIYNSTKYNPVIDSKKLLELKNKLNLKNKKVICFLGGSIKSKGADTLFETLLLLKKKYKNFCVIIAGKFSLKGNKLNRIEKKVKKIIKNDPDLLNYIRFVGVLDDVNPLLKLSDVLIWPAKTSHFARPIIEAMMAETLVLASDFESSREIIVHNKTGFLSKPNSVSFHRILLRILKDKNLTKIVTEAKELANLSFNQKVNLEQNIKLISKII